MACTFSNYIPVMKIQRNSFAFLTFLTIWKHCEYKQQILLQKKKSDLPIVFLTKFNPIESYSALPHPHFRKTGIARLHVAISCLPSGISRYLMSFSFLYPFPSNSLIRSSVSSIESIMPLL